VQRELWHQVVSNAPEGLLRKIDEPLIFAWVAATATHQIAQAELAANGYYHRSAKSGYRVSSPAIGVANRAASMMAKIASELGFSPSARARLSSPPVAADKMPYNPFDKFKD
jgi:P27 family predicted phage terminase small subunit